MKTFVCAIRKVTSLEYLQNINTLLSLLLKLKIRENFTESYDIFKKRTQAIWNNQDEKSLTNPVSYDRTQRNDRTQNGYTRKYNNRNYAHKNHGFSYENHMFNDNPHLNNLGPQQRNFNPSF